MPPKAGRGRGKKKLAGKYRTQKRKAEETEDLEVQEDSSESPTRERRGSKSKKDVSPCTSKTPERSPEGSRSPPPPLPAHQHNVTHDNLRQYLNPDDSVNINKEFNLSALVPHDDNNN